MSLSMYVTVGADVQLSVTLVGPPAALVSVKAMQSESL